MKYEVIASGSSGNCLILNGIIALDVGVAWKQVAQYAKELRLVFVSHTHGDHIKPSTAYKLYTERPTLRFAGGSFMVNDFIRAGIPARNIDVLEPNTRHDYGAFQIEAFPLVHDVPNMGLKIWMGGERALYATDTGTMDGVEFPEADFYFLEANHTRAGIEASTAEKQARGQFAYECRAAQNHLSYEQAMDWLAQNAGPNSRYVLLHQHKDRYGDRKHENFETANNSSV